MTTTSMRDRSGRAVGSRAEKRSSFARVPAAFKLQFTVPSAMIGVPAMVFFAAWAIAAGIGLWVRHLAGPGEPIYTGAAQATVWCLAFMAAYSASHTFPFSMALSYSRRVFVLGAFLAFAALSAGFGALFALGVLMERATDGFGAEAYSFDLPLLTDNGGVLGAALFSAAVCFGAMLFGFFWSILYRRVRLAVVWLVALGLALVLAILVMVITQNGWWPEVGEWLMQQSSVALAGWVMVLGLALAAVNYLVTRRAVPTA